MTIELFHLSLDMENSNLRDRLDCIIQTLTWLVREKEA